MSICHILIPLTHYSCHMIYALCLSVMKVRWFVALFFTLHIFSFFTLGGTTLLGGGHLSVGRGAEVNLSTSLHPYPLLTPLTLYRRKLTMSRKAAPPREPREPPQPPGDPEPLQPENPTENLPVTLETQPAVLGAPTSSGLAPSAKKKTKKARAALKLSQGPSVPDSPSEVRSEAGDSVSTSGKPLATGEFMSVISAVVEEQLESHLNRLTETLSTLNRDSRDRTSTRDAHPSRRTRGPTAAPAGDPDGDEDPHDDDDDGSSIPSQLPQPTRHTARRDGRRRDSIDRMVEGLDGSDLSSMWREGNKLASPQTFSSVGWPPAEGKFMLRKPPRGRLVTARLFLDFYKEHLIMLSQVSYPLVYYIEDDMKALIETFYKEENLKFLPEDLQAVGIIAFANLTNRQLIYIAQLSVRPTSRDKWLEALCMELPPTT